MLKWLKSLFLSKQIPISNEDSERRLIYEGFGKTYGPEAAEAARNLVEVCNDDSSSRLPTWDEFQEDPESYLAQRREALDSSGSTHTPCVIAFEPAGDWASCSSGAPLNAYFCRNCGSVLAYQADTHMYTCRHCGSTLTDQEIAEL